VRKGIEMDEGFTCKDREKKMNNMHTRLIEDENW
jgi:hypothetical protein